LASRDGIESAFGHELGWRANEGDLRSCKLSYDIDHGGWRDEADWPDIYAETVPDMERLAAAVKPHLPAVRARLAALPASTGDLAGDDGPEDEEPGDEGPSDEVGALS
jgi:hypothetical protein